ncbi:MAG: glutathione S-transferase C-terminal domain-containing protein [Alphaproteobacteria bacterium]|nr:glutathione S-transferase C-terminal domain-containing protein [Alphaproteobacteria bacterium]
MGMLIDGEWRADVDRFLQDGVFIREASMLPSATAADLAARLSERPAPILVASLSCPWSHRVTLVKAVKGLHQIPVAIAGEPRTEGYRLTESGGAILGGDGLRHVHQLYRATDSTYSGRATVPLLWEARSQSILCNESATIARALDLASPSWRLAPGAQTDALDALSARLYNGLSNAVYRAGFATAQNAYDDAVTEVFATLDWLEDHLTTRRCLLGQQVSEADLFVFATLARFDSVYGPLFRCTRRRLVDYPALWAYARDVYSWPGVADTVDFQANLRGYFLNDTDNNPHRIVPKLPNIDWDAPHDRAALGPLTIWRNGAQAAFDEATQHADAC